MKSIIRLFFKFNFSKLSKLKLFNNSIFDISFVDKFNIFKFTNLILFKNSNPSVFISATVKFNSFIFISLILTQNF